MADSVKNQKIKKIFEGLESDYWMTIDDISKATNLDSKEVGEIVTTSGDFVRSSYRLKFGEPLYTSRDIFRDKASLVDKVIGAFKNRID